LEEIEKKIQAEVVMKQIRIREFFKDFDPLKKGVVTESQFQRVLKQSGIEIGEKDLVILVSEYKVDNIPNGYVRYSDFCENIDEVFTKKNIEKDPLAVVNKVDSSTTLPTRRHFMVLDIYFYYLIAYERGRERKTVTAVGAL